MSQKTDNLIKLALVFFVSLLSFSIGTYVGKKYSDNQHKLSALEPKKDAQDHATTKSQEFASDAQDPEQSLPTGNIDELTTSTDKPAALTDSEVAKIAEEFAAEEENAEEKIVGQVEPEEKVVGKISATPKNVEKAPATESKVVKAVNPAPVSPVKAVAKLAEKVAAQQKPIDTETITATPVDSAEVREPASIPAKQEMVPMHFTVQIGSFPTQTEAEKMTKSLQDKGYKTSYVPAKVNGQVWYRVNVGLFGTIKEAQDYKKEFLEKTKMSSAIVQRVQQ